MIDVVITAQELRDEPPPSKFERSLYGDDWLEHRIYRRLKKAGYNRLRDTLTVWPQGDGSFLCEIKRVK